MTAGPARVLAVAVTGRDAVARAASEVIGGPMGRHAARITRPWRWVAAVLVALTGLPMAASVALRGYCLSNGWSPPDEFFHMCYSDLPTSYANDGLSGGLVAFLTGHTASGALGPAPSQAPLTSALMSFVGGIVAAATSSPVPGTLGATPVIDLAGLQTYFVIWAALITVALALTTWLVAATLAGHGLTINAAHVALSPVVALVALVAPDALGVVLTAAAVWAWSRGRLITCGVLFGLAIGCQSWPLVVLAALLLVALRAGRSGPAVTVIGTAAIVVGVILVTLAVINPDSAVRSYVEWWQRAPGLGSLWLLPQLAGYPLPAVAGSLLAVLGWLLAIGVGAWLTFGAAHRPGLAEVSLVMVGIVAVTGKQFSVQSSLWLVPLLAWVGLRWADHLVWAAAEALHFGAVWLYLASSTAADRSLPPAWYAGFMVLRVLAVVWLVLRTWQRASSRPGSEPDLDPLAGRLRGSNPALLATGMR